jgi:hypothetical protein
MLFVIMFFICVVGFLILTATIFLKVSPRELFLRCVFASYVLTQKPPPMPPPSDVFRQYVLDPIPKSVTNIKADKPKEIWGYMYTLRFNINRSDLDLLIDSGALEKVWNVKYKKGYLFWGWDRSSPGGRTIIVYHSRRWRKEPRWFRPELWENPEAYAFEKEVGGQKITKILLYNEKEDEAYFIVSSFK